MRTGKKVLLVWIEAELMDKIDDYQHLNKYQFRSEAVKSLLRYALGIENPVFSDNTSSRTIH